MWAPQQEDVSDFGSVSRKRDIIEYAGMVELVDSVDLGSTARACRFESCCPHHKKGYPNRDSPFYIGQNLLQKKIQNPLA